MMKRSVMFTIFLILGILLMVNAVWATNDWIMETDNHDATFSGAWGTSIARILYYGDDYRWALCSGDAGTVSATATFVARTTVDVSGNYSVFARWVVDPNRSTSAKYDIYQDDGDVAPIATNVSRNQEVNGGEWRLLGTYSFDTGDRPKVILKNNCVSEADGANVIADAVRWVKESVDKTTNVDEAGADYDENMTIYSLTSTATTVVDEVISAPTAGYVMVSASAYCLLEGAGQDSIYCQLTTGTTVDTSTAPFAVCRGYGSNDPIISISQTRGFSVSAGSTTFRFVCVEDGGTTRLGRPSMTAIFVPTMY